MLRFDGPEAKKQIEELLGVQIEEVTPRQIWIISKIVREGRRLRSNNALRPWLGRMFPHAHIVPVTKQGRSGSYTGMKITVGAESTEGDEDDSGNDE